MAKLVFGMNQSLDGYVDYTAFGPSPTLFQHYVEQAGEQVGSIYGPRLYELMAYWDEDRPEWDAARREFAAAWRKQHKWVVSHSPKPVGPNATMISADIEATIRQIKDERQGEIQVGGPRLAHSLTALGLIDEYRLYIHPVVLGAGEPLFAGPQPRLRLLASDRMDEDVIRLTYVPA